MKDFPQWSRWASLNKVNVASVYLRFLLLFHATKIRKGLRKLMALKFLVLASSQIKSSGVIYTIYYIPSLGFLYDLVSFCYAF